MNTADSDELLERLGRLPPGERSRALGELRSIGQDTRAFLEAQLEAADIVDQACFQAGQRIRIHPLQRSTETGFDFELEEEIGRGATSSVWRAQDLRLRTTVALKLFEVLGGSERARQRVLREAQAASRVISRHVVRIRDVGQLADGTPFIAMELCAEVPDDGSSAGLRDIGRNLDRDRPATLREAVRLVSEAAKGVADAHREGVYHRDLKPANILCRPKARRAEIIDFGLAVPELLPGTRKRRADQTVSVVVESRSGQRVVLAGTPAYMAPEQCQGLPARAESADDRERLIRVDVYGLGASLYALLAGHPPFQPRPGADDDALDVVAQVLDGPPPDLAEIPTRFAVPGRLLRIVRKAMARDPARRFRSPRELAEALKAFLDHRPSALDHGLGVRIGLWSRRNRTLVRTALGLTGISVVFAALWFVSVQRLVGQRDELEGTIAALEGRRGELQSHNARLQEEKAALSEERDRLRADLGILSSISDDLQAIEKTIDGHYRRLDRRQRKILDDRLTSSGLKDELSSKVEPVTRSLSQIELRLGAAATQEQLRAIRDDLEAIRTRLTVLAPLKDQVDGLQRRLDAVVTESDLEPLKKDLRDLRKGLDELRSLGQRAERAPSGPAEKKAHRAGDGEPAAGH
ncbi:MAG: protein kinase [Deltaproteobacteria bacterium]|nr:protein kinase [Deltaproteobacteria bacterium]